MRVLPGLMAALLLVPAGAVTVSAQDFGAIGTTETVPCPEKFATGAAFAKAGTEVEGTTYSCGVVVVPENHEQPDGRLIELFYLKLHSSSATPAADPMVYLAGGPGSSASYELTSNPLLHDNLDRIRADRDIIAYDQRGTGYSNHLLCAPFESALGILQDRDKNPEIAQAIKDLEATDLGAGYAALRANLCGLVTRLLAGTDLAQYNSVSSAKDIPQLVKALGYTDGYSLYGTSYGTRLAQEVMRTAPDGLKGVVLDGSGGPAIPNGMLSILKAVSPYQEVFARCAADAACNAAYPDISTRFAAVLDKLATTPLVIDPPLTVFAPLTFALPPVLKQIDPAFFQQIAAIDNIAIGGAFAGSLPRMVKAVEDGEVDWFRSSPIAAPASDAAKPPVQTGDPVGKDPTPTIATDQPLYAVPFQTLLGLAQAAASKPQPGIDGQWLSIVLGDLATRFLAGENQADLMEALLRLAVAPNMGTTADVLTRYANGNLTASAADAANAIVGQMSRGDVRTTLWTIGDLGMMLGTHPDDRSFSDGMQYAFNCADELAFTSLDVAQKALADSPFPQLAGPMAIAEVGLASCGAYPSPLDKRVTDPVTSDIPALVYVSALDTETPAAWGREVAKNLGRSTVVEWANTGHVVAAHDPKLCAGEIAAAFLEDPTAKPDVSCARGPDYQLTFTMP